jgi:hypothetical protein
MGNSIPILLSVFATAENRVKRGLGEKLQIASHHGPSS